MKVYTVESGDYSDYRVHGVFSTEENAKKWMGDYGGYEIVEREMDDFSDAQVTVGGKIAMDMSTGVVKWIVPENSDPLKNKWQGPNIDIVKGYSQKQDDSYLEMYFDYYDKERMTKVAGEKRAQILFNISIFGKLRIHNGGRVKFGRDSCLPVDPEWHKKFRDALDVVEEAAVNNLANFGAPEQVYDPESGQFIIRNGKPTEYGKKLLAQYKEKK